MRCQYRWFRTIPSGTHPLSQSTGVFPRRRQAETNSALKIHINAILTGGAIGQIAVFL
jgi:hypothetical protein